MAAGPSARLVSGLSREGPWVFPTPWRVRQGHTPASAVIRRTRVSGGPYELPAAAPVCPVDDGVERVLCTPCHRLWWLVRASHTQTLARTRTRTRADTYARTRARAHTHTLAHVSTYIDTLAHDHPHGTLMRVHIHTYTHVHDHACT